MAKKTERSDPSDDRPLEPSQIRCKKAVYNLLANLWKVFTTDAAGSRLRLVVPYWPSGEPPSEMFKYMRIINHRVLGNIRHRLVNKLVEFPHSAPEIWGLA